ncbi:hypothetical protein [Mucilaginibacter sp.]|uniref:hypothetical protein n=1 Tax=Mucilaginibacter sp. TaxID=1882438 RepID=UPI0026343168|nr:hypothetical protein [Mucilaginibacter sp.]
MKVAVIDWGGYDAGPDRFSEQELATAGTKGVVIKNNHSKTVGKAYLSNTCPKCEIFTGDHFLFTDYYTEALYGYLPFESISQGYSCKKCDVQS